MSSKRKIPEGWYSKSEMARIFGTQPRNFDATYRRYASPKATQEIEGKLYFHSRSLLDAWADSQRKVPAKQDPAAPDDPLMAADGDSPALEEYRRARARLAWMDVNEREETAIPVDEVRPALLGFTQTLRRAGDRLARQHGNEAAMILNEAVDQWEESVEKLFSEDETDTTTAQGDSAQHSHSAASDDT